MRFSPLPTTIAFFFWAALICAADEAPIRDLSPDGHFAFRVREQSTADLEMVALPSRKVVMKIEAGDFSASGLIWSSDAKRFAFSQDAGSRVTNPRVFERSGATFREVEWPGLPSEGLPRNGRHDREHVRPVRWLDADTLLLHDNYWCILPKKGSGEDSDDDWNGDRLVQVRFTSKGTKVIQATPWKKLDSEAESEKQTKLETITKGPGVQPGMPDVFAHEYGVLPQSSPNQEYGFAVARGQHVEVDVDEVFLVRRRPFQVIGALDDVASDMTASWSPDSSAALVLNQDRSDPANVMVAGINLVEMHGGRLARVTNLFDTIRETLMADYRICNPNGAADDDPDISFPVETPELDRDGKVRIHCEAIFSPEKDDTRKEWAARLDAEWSVKEHRFVKQKLVRALGEVGGWPEGAEVPERFNSPDGRYGVMKPANYEASLAFQTTLVDLKSHQQLGVIEGPEYGNRHSVGVSWADDSSWCAVIGEGRFGFQNITLVEPHGDTCTQTDLGEHIQKVLNGAVGDAFFRSAPGRMIFVRVPATHDPKAFKSFEGVLFEGTYDLKSRKWTRSATRRIEDFSEMTFAYGDDVGEYREFASEEDRLKSYDGMLNTVYTAVRTLVPAGRFAGVKKEQAAWLKKLEAAATADKKCELIKARIKELRQCLWQDP